MFPLLRPLLAILPLALLATAALAAPELDAAFGADGRVALELGREGSANAVLVQPDGKILIAGSAIPGQGKSFALARFNPDGTLDAGFGREGALTTSLSLGDDEVLALALLSDGRIVAGGSSTREGRRVFALACYLPDGRLDPDFGRNGVTLTAVGGGDDEITALAVAPDDMILAAGTVSGPVGAVAAAARYDAWGELDAAFGERGVALLGVGDESRVEGILPREDGGLLLSGTFRRGGRVSLMLTALDAHGRLDAGFGAAGLALPPGELPSEGYRLAEDEENLIYVAGAVGEPGRRDTALFRFFPDGRPDPDFGRAGVVINPVSPDDDALFDVAVHERGIVACGFAVEAGQRRLLTASYAAANGSPDGLRLPVPHLEASGKLPALTAVLKKRPKQRPRRAERAQERPEPPKNAEESPQASAGETPSAPSGHLCIFLRASEPRFPCPRKSLGGRLKVCRFAAKKGPLPEGAAERKRGWGSLFDFLLPSAAAAELPPEAPAPKVRLFDFGAGEAVGHAAALDAQGNVVVAGMAGQGAGTVMAIARFAAASLYNTDAFVNQAGGESPALRTFAPLAVTRSTARCGGEVLPDLGEVATRRGLVFSTAAHPVLAPAEGGDKPPERGEAAAGSGVGPFSVTLSGLRPATRYHVRAYAVTPGGVRYGPQRVFTTAEACFVATAAFGSTDHPLVVLFRHFRDKTLMPTTLGAKLVDMYYKNSPPLAHLIERHDLLRPLAALLLLPLAAFAALSLAIGPAPACLVFLLPLVTLWRRRGERQGRLLAKSGGCCKPGTPSVSASRCHLPQGLFQGHGNLGFDARRKMQRLNFPPRGGAHGFTLIEVMVVMVILGILAALIAPRIMDRPEEGRRTQAVVQMRAIEQALKLYRLDNGQYPSTEQGLHALVAPPATGRPAKKWRQGGYLERGRVPKDPWGADYVYLSPGLHDDFDLISYGADNQPGGEGKDADVNNWEMQ